MYSLYAMKMTLNYFSLTVWKKVNEKFGGQGQVQSAGTIEQTPLSIRKHETIHHAIKDTACKNGLKNICQTTQYRFRSKFIQL